MGASTYVGPAHSKLERETEDGGKEKQRESSQKSVPPHIVPERHALEEQMFLQVPNRSEREDGWQVTKQKQREEVNLAISQEETPELMCRQEDRRKPQTP